jgi:hypothetical protein
VVITDFSLRARMLIVIFFEACDELVFPSRFGEGALGEKLF